MVSGKQTRTTSAVVEQRTGYRDPLVRSVVIFDSDNDRRLIEKTRTAAGNHDLVASLQLRVDPDKKALTPHGGINTSRGDLSFSTRSGLTWFEQAIQTAIISLEQATSLKRKCT